MKKIKLILLTLLFLFNQSLFSQSITNTSLGTGAGTSLTSGTNNSLFGYNAGNWISTGAGNSFFGAWTGATSKASAIGNTFIGYLAANQGNGDSSVVIGANAGITCQTGNVYIGNSAASNGLNTGNYNCMIGFSSGYTNSSGSRNTFLGYNSGYNNFDGNNNVYIGSQAGYANNDGFDNVFIGNNAGYVGSLQFQGINNSVFIGNSAGENIQDGAGSSSVLMGTQAGQNSDGYNNVLIGNSSGQNLSGGNNVCIGQNSGNNGVGDNNIYLGINSASNASGNASNNSLLGGYSGFSLISGDNNTLLGWYAGRKTSSGSHNVCVGDSAGYSNTTGSYNTYIGNLAHGNAGITKSTAIGYNANVTMSNNIVLGQNSSSVKVAIGYTSSSTYKLDVNGIVRGTSFTAISDQRYKKNIETIDKPLEKVEKLNGVFYDWKREEFPQINFENKRQAGFIAQELKKIIPEAVMQDAEGYYSVNYNAVIPFLIEGMKELDKQVHDYSAQISKYKEIIQMMQQEIDQKCLTKTKSGFIPNDSLRKLLLYPNNPNPFNKYTTISYKILFQPRQVILEIRNEQSILLKSVELPAESGTGTLQINADEFATGIYFYSVIADGMQSEVRKFSIIK